MNIDMEVDVHLKQFQYWNVRINTNEHNKQTLCPLLAEVSLLGS
jgi:hypothetical protein